MSVFKFKRQTGGDDVQVYSDAMERRQIDGVVATLAPDDDTIRRRSARARAEAEVRREQDRQRIVDQLDAYKRERYGFEQALERAQAAPDVAYAVRDTSGVGPPGAFVIAGNLRDYATGRAQDGIAECDKAIERAEAELAEFDRS